MAKLLVVDDEPEINMLVARLFEKRGYEVLQCGDGEAALAMIAAQRPDLILLDLNLPKIDGWEVCRRMKAAPETKHIPIIMMTAAHANVDDAQAGLAIGADEYVAKPFVRDLLIYNVERLLNPGSARDQNGELSKK
jgi:DNA-binding response OmpR family regulator